MTDAATEKARAAHAELEVPRTIVVIGGGQAAGWVVKTLRKEGYDGRLVMIADEVHLPTNVRRFRKPCFPAKRLSTPCVS